MVGKNQPKKIIRTISSYVTTGKKIQNKIFKFMCNEAKNIYNVSVLHIG